MKQWTTAAAIAFVFVSCGKGNKIYSGPSDNNSSSLNNKISVAEMVTITASRSLSSVICSKDSNADISGFRAIVHNSEMPDKCNGLLKIAGRHF